MTALVHITSMKAREPLTTFTIELRIRTIVGEIVQVQSISVSNVISFRCKCTRCHRSFESRTQLEEHSKSCFKQVNVVLIGEEGVELTETDLNTSSCKYFDHVLKPEPLCQKLSNSTEFGANCNAIDAAVSKANNTGDILIGNYNNDGIDLESEDGDQVGSTVISAVEFTDSDLNRVKVSDPVFKPATLSQELSNRIQLHAQCSALDAVDSEGNHDLEGKYILIKSKNNDGADPDSDDGDGFGETVTSVSDENNDIDTGVQMKNDSTNWCASKNELNDEVIDLATPYQSFQISNNSVAKTLLQKKTSDAKYLDVKTNAHRDAWKRKKKYNLSCEYCGKTCVSQNAIALHIRSHTGEKTFLCEVCTKGFSVNTALKVQRRIQSGEPTRIIIKKLPCSYGGKKWRSPRALKLHIRSHTGEKPFECDVCGEAFAENNALIAHSRIHLGLHMRKRINSLPCSYCGKSWRSLSALKLHIRSHTGEKPFQCDVCGRAFTDNGTLKAHSRIHLGLPVRKETAAKLPCPFCPKMFRSQSFLEGHIRSHMGEKPYSCDVCGKQYAGKRELKVHGRIHTGEKPYVCTLCNSAYASSGVLQKHILRKHKKKSFQCPMCGQMFADSGYFTAHLKTHEANNPCKCNVCGKSLTFRGCLAKHMRIHSGEKPYECSECGKRFTQSSNMERHKKSHSADKPYTCSVCSASLKTKQNLARHVQIHEGSNRSECTICGKKLTRRHMKTHMTKHVTKTDTSL